MPDKLIGLTQAAFARMAKVVRRVERTMEPAPRIKRRIFGTVEGESVGGDGGGCCCNLLNCITTAQATVTECGSCADGAAYQYTATFGSWAAWPTLGGTQILTYGIQANLCGSSSSSSSSSSASCIWTSCLISVCSSSSSSSSSSVCGVYQWRLTMNGASTTLQLLLVSGTDVVGL